MTIPGEYLQTVRQPRNQNDRTYASQSDAVLQDSAELLPLLSVAKLRIFLLTPGIGHVPIESHMLILLSSIKPRIFTSLLTLETHYIDYHKLH